MLATIKILIPDVTSKTRVAEAYDGNVWLYFKWKRSNLIFVSIWMILLGVATIQFSFCSWFGNNIYVCIIGLKVIA